MDRRTAKEFLHLRDWLIHQYDQIDRALTWTTLAKDVPAWRAALSDDFIAAQKYLEDDAT